MTIIHVLTFLCGGLLATVLWWVAAAAHRKALERIDEAYGDELDEDDD